MGEQFGPLQQVECFPTAAKMIFTNGHVPDQPPVVHRS